MAGPGPASDGGCRPLQAWPAACTLEHATGGAGGAGKGSGSPDRVDWRRAGEGQGRRRQALGEEGRGHGRRWPGTEKAMVKLAGKHQRKRKNEGKTLKR